VRISNISGFVALTSVTTFLVGIMSHTPKTRNNIELLNEQIQIQKESRFTLPPDTPEVKEPVVLPYDFKDNQGAPPQYDPNSKLYLENPSNIKTNVDYDPKTGNYDVSQKIGDLDYRPDTYLNFKEYERYVYKKAIRDYWRSRVSADEIK
jgi:hypothetical protein